MATTTTFPTIRNVLYSGKNLQQFTAGEDLKAGKVVGMAATGVSMTVVAMNNTAGEIPIGVALYDTDSGDECTVACTGCICYLADGAGAGFEAGQLVQSDTADGTVTGCIAEFTPRADQTATISDANDTHQDGTTYVVGISLDAFTANLTGRVLVIPYVSLWSDHAAVT